MGVIKKGILGSFSGKVGNVVGGTWRGIAYMRSLPAKVKNPRTVGQRSQRSKFTLALSVLKPLTAILRVGWKLYAQGKSPFNAASSYIHANAITGEYPDFSIDASKILISRGALTPAVNAKATLDNDTIVVQWDDNSGSASAQETDRALIAVLNTAKAGAITSVDVATRADGTQTLPTPPTWAGDKVDVFLGFVSEDAKEVANSVCCGKIQIV